MTPPLWRESTRSPAWSCQSRRAQRQLAARGCRPSSNRASSRGRETSSDRTGGIWILVVRRGSRQSLLLERHGDRGPYGSVDFFLLNGRFYSTMNQCGEQPAVTPVAPGEGDR